VEERAAVSSGLFSYICECHTHVQSDKNKGEEQQFVSPKINSWDHPLEINRLQNEVFEYVRLADFLG